MIIDFWKYSSMTGQTGKIYTGVTSSFLSFIFSKNRPSYGSFSLFQICNGHFLYLKFTSDNDSDTEPLLPLQTTIQWLRSNKNSDRKKDQFKQENTEEVNLLHDHWQTNIVATKLIAVFQT